MEGDTQADLLANAGRLASPLYPSRQQGPQHCEQQGEPPPKGRKLEHFLPSHQKQVLSEGDAAIFLRPIGLDLMSDFSPSFGEVYVPWKAVMGKRLLRPRPIQHPLVLAPALLSTH